MLFVEGENGYGFGENESDFYCLYQHTDTRKLTVP